MLEFPSKLTVVSCGVGNLSYLCPRKRERGMVLSIGGNSSVGRARPCQGRGREFESRFPLDLKDAESILDVFLFLRGVGLRPGWWNR